MKLSRLPLLLIILIGFITVNNKIVYSDTVSDGIEIINYDFLSRENQRYSETNPIIGSTYVGLRYSFKINNYNKTIKNGTKKTIVLSTGPFAANVSMRLMNLVKVNLQNTAGELIGELNVSSRTNGDKIEYINEIVFNSNIENKVYTEGEIIIPSIFVHHNNTLSANFVPINTEFGNVNKVISSRGESIYPLTTSEWHRSIDSRLNELIFNIFSGYELSVALGNESRLPQKENIRGSYWINEAPSKIAGPSLNARFFIPIASNSNDKRLSTRAARTIEVNNFITRIQQNPGETWNDFKTRVYSKKYQHGVYSNSQGTGYAMNLGDITDKGWKNGEIKIPNIYGGTIQEFAASLRSDTFGVDREKAFIDIYGPTGRINQGIPLLYGGNIAVYPNFSQDRYAKHDWEFLYYEPYSKQNILREQSSNTLIPSTKYSNQVSKGSVTTKIIDKDTTALLPNVRVSLLRNVNGNYIKQGSTLTTDSSGQVTFSNLSSGTYKIDVENRPSGYQDPLEFKIVINDINQNSNGEFVLNQDTGILMQVGLEKIKHQSVRFTVTDTASKPIVGEIFQIYKDGVSSPIIEYPTNNQGIFSISRIDSGNYRLLSQNKQRIGYSSFIVEEGKTNTLEVEAVLPVIPEITANGPNSINLGNVNIGQVTRSTIPLDVTYRGDNGYIVTARQSNNTNVNFELNDSLVTTQEKEFTNLEGTANPVTTMINYQLNAKTNSNSTKGNKSTNIIFSFKYKL